MKKFLWIAVVTFTSLSAIAQPPKGDAKVGDSYGVAVAADGASDIAVLADKVGNEGGIHTKIKAKILEVCPKKGCWLKLAVNDSTTAFVKMKDYAFFVPTAAAGKTVVIDGEIKSKMVSVAEQRHYAEDAKKSEAEINAITQPKRELRVTANGITVVE